jgi:hypothetical protein
MRAKFVNEKKETIPDSQFKKDKDHLYGFTFYDKHGDKEHYSYYTLEEIMQIKSIAKRKGYVISIWKANMENDYVDEINI